MGPSSDWKDIRLGDIVEVKHGWPFKSELMVEELTGFPVVVSIGNFQYSGGFRFESTTLREYRGLYPEEYVLSPGDILLVMTCQTPNGEILGIPARIPQDDRVYLHNQRLGKIVVKEPKCVDEKYLYWVFLWPEFNRELFLSATGTKILHTAPSRIEAFRFRLPPLEEQRGMSRILESLNNKIELSRRMNQTLEAMARAIFKSWFVDFKEKGTRVSRIEPLCRGLIPGGWSLAPIGDAVTVVGGSTPSTSDQSYWNGPYNFATPKDLAGLIDPVLLKTERTITSEGLGQIGSGLLPIGTVLLSSRAPIGYLAITQVPVAVNQGFIAMICDKVLPSYYVYEWARHSMETIIGRANGTTFLEVSKRNFRPIQVVIPPKPELDRYVDLVTPMFNRITASVRESATLAAIRDALLPKLLSGEIRVKQAEKIVEEAV